MNNKYRNCTGSNLIIKDKNNQLIKFKKEETKTFVEYKEITINNEKFKIVKQAPSKIIDLPNEETGIINIVSIQVLEAIKYLNVKRNDLLAPNTITGARKNNNKILYTNSFIK